ncbi:uncharacterized protein [Palaemon carinicauda]|uniref:uncharacterized protein n=1 Tax=Palaemon carinicauda TaxID=392227 RepID=UPI0035B632AF
MTSCPCFLAEDPTNRGRYMSSIISSDIREMAKKLRKEAKVTVRRADKPAAFVLIVMKVYHRKLDLILADTSKFEKLLYNLIEETKRETNKTIETINATAMAIHHQTIIREFSPGYLYSNVNTHKNDNPLRPIISRCPTATYYLAKSLKNLLTHYVPDKFIIALSAEFLSKRKRSTSNGTITFLDV